MMIILNMNLYVVFSSSNDIPKSQCVLYFMILFNEAMKPTMRICYCIKTKHKQFFNQSIEFFY